MANAYIFYGKAGSGKGTQAEMLEKHLITKNKKVINIGQGKAFRNFAQEEGYVQDLTRETLNSGNLMPAFMPIYLWSKRLVENFTGTEDFIFDGVARVLEEADILSKALQYLKFEKVFVFHISLMDSTATSRIKSRAMIAGDTARADDLSEDAIQRRLDAYQNEVLPIVEYFKNNPRNKFVEIDGEVSIEEVFEQVTRSIE